MSDEIVIDHDPAPGKWWLRRAVPVVLVIDPPPVAVSNGWGDMSWLK